MAGSYNKITIIGNLGRDPELRYTPSGTALCDFTIATNQRRGKDQQEIVTWFRATAFGKVAETCNQYLHKGSYVYLEGTLRQDEWTDKDGNARTTLCVDVREMRMLDSRSAGSSASQPYASDGEPAMDDIPF